MDVMYMSLIYIFDSSNVYPYEICVLFSFTWNFAVPVEFDSAGGIQVVSQKKFFHLGLLPCLTEWTHIPQRTQKATKQLTIENEFVLYHITCVYIFYSTLIALN